MRLALIAPLLLVACPDEPVDTTPDVPVGALQVFTPDRVDFGRTPLGEEASPVQVTIGNPGDEPLDVYTIELTEPELGLSIGSVGDGQRIRAGSEGTFIVKLLPTAPGTITSQVRVSSNVTPPDDPAVLVITAEVVTAQIAADPTSITVEDVGSEGRFEVTLTNPGKALLTVTDVAVEGSEAFGVDPDTGRNGALPWELEPDDGSGFPKRVVYATWDPSQATGTDSGTLVVTSDAWGDERLRIPLSVP